MGRKQETDMTKLQGNKEIKQRKKRIKGNQNGRKSKERKWLEKGQKQNTELQRGKGLPL